MAVPYSVSGRRKPGVKDGPVKYYAQVQASDECPFKTLTRTAADRSTVTAADAKAVMDNVMTVLKEKLAAGQIVRIDDLGSFRVAISTEGVEEADKFTAANIKKARIVFTPCKELKNLCKTFEYKKTMLSATKLAGGNGSGDGSGTGGTGSDDDQGANPLG